jgi:hypothetical protein
MAIAGTGASAGERSATNGVAADTAVTSLGIDSAAGNQVLIAINSAKSGGPACSSNGTWAFVLPLETPAQRHMFTILLQARTSESPITLLGSGLCDASATVETLAQLIF